MKVGFGRTLVVLICQAVILTVSPVWAQKKSLTTQKNSVPPKNATPPKTLSPQKADTNASWSPPNWPIPRIDEQKLQSHGIRRLAGAHLVLYTDVPRSPDVDELPRVFDLAVPLWCQYFNVDPASVRNWRVLGYLIKDESRFQAAQALRSDIPKFLNGYQYENELWLYEQSSSYYRRHLLLHEGTHGFMNWRLGGAGPPWYMEGMAELLATHEWKTGRLSLRHFPKSADEVPDWGRIRIIKDGVKSDQALTLEQIMRYDDRAHLKVEPYGWCWAAAVFFDQHPRWQNSFRALRKDVRDMSIGFSQRFYSELKSEWSMVRREWQLFVHQIDYDYDVASSAIEPQRAEPLPISGRTLRVAANRGWQSTGVAIESGKEYRISARGQFQLRDSPDWICEPNGVTIRYYRGLPLGMLIGVVVDENGTADKTSLLQPPMRIGAGVSWKSEHAGTLYVRLNDSPSELKDNSGVVDVTVRSE